MYTFKGGNMIISTGTKVVLVASLVLPQFGLMAQKLEEAPVPPKIEGKEMELKRQAGIGSEFAYAESGVVEVGGSINFSDTKSRVSSGFTPSVGYFFNDNLQISALTNFTYTRLKDKEATGDTTSRSGSIVLEPSVHMPVSRTQFVFGGLGLGLYFAKGQDTGTAIAPRVGYKTLVGRSGMLTAALQGVYALNKEDNENIDGTVITVENGANIDIGYSVLF
jgi:hypothetical protein